MSEWIFVSKKDSVGQDLFYKEGPPNFSDISDDCIAVNTIGFYKRGLSLPLVDCPYYTKDSDGIYVRKSAIEELFSDDVNVELQSYILD
jgi:hypothetical protein